MSNNKAVIVIVMVIALAVLEGVYIWYLISRIDQVKEENTRNLAKVNRCLGEQQVMRMDFENTLAFLSEANAKREQQLRQQCPGGGPK